MNLTLQTLLGSIGLIRVQHVDEAKAARVPSMRVAKDVAFFDFAKFREELNHVIFIQTRMKSGDEKVRSGVASCLFIFLWRFRGRGSTI